MEQWLNSIPKPVLIVGIMLLGAFLAWQSEPPKDYCDNQISVFEQALEGVIYPTKLKRGALPPKIGKDIELCMMSNSKGGCFSMFQDLQAVVTQLKIMLPECQIRVLSESRALAAFKQGIQTMATIAWGEEPPGLGPERFAWLEDPELKLFCEMQSLLVAGWEHEEEAWPSFQNQVLSSLKDVKKVPREEVLGRSLFSTYCGY